VVRVSSYQLLICHAESGRSQLTPGAWKVGNGGGVEAAGGGGEGTTAGGEKVICLALGPSAAVRPVKIEKAIENQTAANKMQC
jgi:hypothetical protein